MQVARPPSWAALLAFLEADIAVTVEGIARRLQVLMESDPRWAPGTGEPNGYGGIDRRGPLDRLLLSEWLYAAEEPLEFSRRLAMGELAYLRQELVTPRSPTRIVLIADVGPDQLGVPRLVHLAGLVVLARRAEAHGVPLELGLLSDEPGSYRGGELPELFGVWRRARSSVRPSAEAVDGWLNTLDDRDHAWLFTGVGAAPADADLNAGVRRLTVRESDWGHDGATAAEVVVDRNVLRLPLPPPSDSVKLLRGDSLKRHATAPIAGSQRTVTFPRFTGRVRRLLCRAGSSDTLLGISVPREETTTPRRARPHVFPGPVLAAATIGPRTVAVVSVAASIRVHVIGKRLGSVAAIDADPAVLQLDARAIDLQSRTTLETLFFDSGAVVARLAGRWWRLHPREAPVEFEFVAVGATEASDRPRFARLMSRLQVTGEYRPIDDYAVGGAVLFGPRGSLAYETGPGAFAVRGRFADLSLSVDEDSLVRGLVLDGSSQPWLVVQSAGSRIIRLQGRDHSRTLSGASGDIVDLTVHPTEPLLAIQRGDGTVEVFDLPEGRLLAYLVPD